MKTNEQKEKEIREVYERARCKYIADYEVAVTGPFLVQPPDFEKELLLQLVEYRHPSLGAK